MLNTLIKKVDCVCTQIILVLNLQNVNPILINIILAGNAKILGGITKPQIMIE